MGRPLTPGQPPWEMHVIEGLAGGRVGLIAKVHHAVIDGVAGAELLAQLLDLAPEGRRHRDVPARRVPRPACPRSPLVADALPNIVGQPGPGRAGGPRGRPDRARRAAGPLAVDERSDPCRSPSGRRAPSRRRSADAAPWLFARLDLRRRAVAQGALRRHGERRRAGRLLGRAPTHLARARNRRIDARSWRWCRCRVRGAVRDRREPALRHVRPAGERPQTPLERLLAVMEASDIVQGTGARRRVRARWRARCPTRCHRRWPGRWSSSGCARACCARSGPATCMISNVPGPDVPLYFAGMELRALHPLGPVVDGMRAQHHGAELLRRALRRHQRLRTHRARAARAGSRHGRRAGPALCRDRTARRPGWHRSGPALPGWSVQPSELEGDRSTSRPGC